MSITCFLPVFNAEVHLPAWWSRNGAELEAVGADLLVIDNGSTDGTLRCVEDFEYPKTRVISNTVNLGLEVSLERAKSLISTEYRFIMPADDWLAPGYLKEAVDVMNCLPDVGVVYGLSYMAFENVVSQRFHPGRPIGIRQESPAFHLLFNNSIPDISVFRSAVIKSESRNGSWLSDGAQADILASSSVFFTGRPQSFSGKSKYQVSKQWDASGKYYRLFQGVFDSAARLPPEKFFIGLLEDQVLDDDGLDLLLARDLFLKAININFHTGAPLAGVFFAFQNGHPHLRSAIRRVGVIVARSILYALVDELVSPSSGAIKPRGRLGKSEDIGALMKAARISDHQFQAYVSSRLGIYSVP
jgi:glycosyltransferase involved in cell wall biosynthesis